MRNQKISLNLSKSAQSYLRFVAAAFVGAGLACAGLYLHLFRFVDSVNSYILATQLFHSMIRTTAAAAMLTLAIDFLSAQEEEP